ncbi:MAG: purine-nucleoside/S-methyl-5-thioadenosine phosphorylase / adenosine deaminase [Solirubrobacteraceae bacterium]|nr:purine-nucleoside/S-methyl-5-thioadenosine phosphorylase / adenosine deaminase [Solirubrobacteraceae bacterium]
MTLRAPFATRGDHITIDLPGGRVLFSTRRGGVSEGRYVSLNLGRFTDDRPADVEENRGRLAALAGVAADQLLHGRQVHAATVRRVTTMPHPGESPEPADGQATALRGVAPLVLTADCLPVALVSPGAVAMVHAGWRGLAAGVLEEGVSAVRELGGGGELSAALGPAARVCCYEVGEEVHAHFADYGPEVRRGRCLDLPLAARRRLEGAGVSEVWDSDLCTMCSDPSVFFSHRREGGVTGRQAGVVWRT